MKIYVVMSNIFSWVMEVCKTKELAEQVIKKDMDYYNFNGSMHSAERKDYNIVEKVLIEG